MNMTIIINSAISLFFVIWIFMHVWIYVGNFSLKQIIINLQLHSKGISLVLRSETKRENKKVHFCSLAWFIRWFSTDTALVEVIHSESLKSVFMIFNPNLHLSFHVWRIWKWKEKRTEIIWPSRAGIRTPGFQ